MTEDLDVRFKRILHSITERSAARMLLFLATDYIKRQSYRTSGNNSAVECGYRQDRDGLDDSVPEIFPQVVFQTWKSKSVIPSNYRYWRDTFVFHNPDSRILLWDDADNRAFIEDRYPWALALYDSYPREIFRADAVRLFFLLEFGGMYADMDSECLRPIAEHASVGEVVLCRMGGNPAFAHSIPNAIMASRPGQLFWLFAIKCMAEAARKISHDTPSIAMSPETLTGPVLIKKAYDTFVSMDEDELRQELAVYIDKLTPRQRSRLRYSKPVLLEPEAWYPLDWTNLFQKSLCNRLRRDKRMLPQAVAKRLFPHSSVVTYWSHSW